MTRRFTKPRVFKRVALLLIALVSAFVLIDWGNQRRGLFNNRSDLASAMSEHQRAWQAQGRGSQIPRLDLLMITRRYEGACITSEANWVSVQLDQRIDPTLLDGQPLIECRYRVRARALKGLYYGYVWTLFLRASNAEELLLVGTKRELEK